MQTVIRYLVVVAAFAFSVGAQAGEVSRAVFATAIDNREPVATVESLDSSTTRSITFFTELNDLSGQTITHQWMHNDKVMFEKSFEVKAQRWRVWTSKTLIPNWSGTWTVNVLDAEHTLLASKSFDYL